jgi:hypothetical protein
MIRKITAGFVAFLAVSVLVPTLVITHTYIVRPHQIQGWGDWLQVLLPVLPPTVTICASLALWMNEKRSLVWKGTTWGFLISCTIYMLLQALILSRHFSLISQDGEAHWGGLQLPAIWIATPLLIIGVILGLSIGLILKKIRAQAATSGVTLDTIRK